LITLATYGVGMLVGFWAAGLVADSNIAGTSHDWYTIWILPAAFSLGVFLLFLFSFKNEEVDYSS
ncbi:MAG: MFS transporter, partial [Bacteroidota bacterium]